MYQFLGLSILFPLVIAIILLYKNVFGLATTWCWIGVQNQSLRFYSLYLFVLIAWIYNTIIFNLISNSIRLRIHRSGMNDGSFTDTETIIRTKIRSYLLIFIFSWFFGLLDRLLQYIHHGQPLFIPSLFTATFVPLQGFLNAICYGGLFDNDSSFIVLLRRTWLYHVLPSPSITSDDGHFSLLTSTSNPVYHQDRDTEKYVIHSHNNTHNEGNKHESISTVTPKTYSIFVSTFNLGEAPVHNFVPSLSDWIPKGHDIYVIGLQECIDLLEMRQAIHHHIGGSQIFTIHTVEIGSTNTAIGYHGYIALTVFIKNHDMENGYIRLSESSSDELATGANLIITRASNKGAVGLPFQIHDTSIAFLTAHLPSDSHGISKLNKRNCNLQSILNEMILSSEDVCCDVHQVHDHCILLGDLNYRISQNNHYINNQINSSNNNNHNNSNNNNLHTKTRCHDVIEQVLTTISIATQTELQTMLTNTSISRTENIRVPSDIKEKVSMEWMKMKYSLLKHYSTDNYQINNSISNNDEEELGNILGAKKSSRSDWDYLLARDELRQCMDIGEIFSNWVEPMPRFPPSYKHYKRDVKGLPKDYSNMDYLRSTYVVSGENMRERTSSISTSATTLSTVTNDITTDYDHFEVYQTPSGSTYNDVEKDAGDAPIITTRTRQDSNASRTPRRPSLNAVSAVPFPSIVSPQDSAPSGKAHSIQMSPSTIPRTSSFSRGKQSQSRVPSYTDRILYHSLKSSEGRLTSAAYEMCHDVLGSDHRPVSMVLKLEVSYCTKALLVFVCMII